MRGGGAHAARSVRIARCGSGGPSQRPAPPRRAQKGAGDVVSSVEKSTRTDTKRRNEHRTAGGRVKGGGYMPPAPCVSLGMALAGPSSAQDRPGGLRKGRGRSFPRPGCLTKVHAPNVEMDTEGRAGGSKGGLHAAGSSRIARYASGGPSQRPVPPRRAQKGAGEVVSSARFAYKSLRRVPQNVSWAPWRRAGGCGGVLHAAGSLRIVRHGSVGFNQRPGPPRRAQKGAGEPAALTKPAYPLTTKKKTLSLGGNASKGFDNNI